ncbi:MAG: hypothetical protein EZS28_012918, partial [Streblomastix strix]
MVIKTVQKEIDQNNRLVWHSPPLLTKEQCIMCEQGAQDIGHVEGAEIEHGAIGDNIIVVSHKRIAYVLLWHPAIPQLLNKQWPNQSWSPITRITATAMGDEGKKMAYTNHEQQEPTQKEDGDELLMQNKANERNYTQEQIKLYRNAWMMPQVLTTIATLKGPSQITSITTSVICGRHFVVICFDNPVVCQVYRLDTNDNANSAIIERDKIWDFTNKTVCDGYGKFKYSFIKKPNLNINTSVKGQFVETDEKSGKFLANINNKYITLVRVFDVELNDYAHTCVLTTFERHVRKLGNDENIFPDEAIMEMNEQKLYRRFKHSHIQDNQENVLNDNSIRNNHESFVQNDTSLTDNLPIQWEKQRRCGQYRENDGAVIAIGGRYGQVAFTCVPLVALMLEQAPIEYASSLESIQAIITKQTIQVTFSFPSLISFLQMGREPIELIEDNQFIYVRGERTQILEFNSKYCQIIFRALSANDKIVSTAPICVDDDREFGQIKMNQIMDYFDENDIKNETKNSLLPTLLWIEDSTRTLKYGQIDKRRRMNRVMKELPTAPISITYLPSLHAFAVLLREQSLYPYSLNENDQNIENESYEKNNNINQQTPFFTTVLKCNENNERNDNKMDYSKVDQDAQSKKKKLESEERIRKLRHNYGVEGLGLDISGQSLTGFGHEQPFRRIVGEYLKKKLELKIERRNQQSNISNIQKIHEDEYKIKIDVESDICAKQESTLTIRNAMMQMSAPIYDTNGIPFTDLAADHFADKNSMLPKNYRPLHILPEQQHVETLCYSPNMNFKYAFPSWIDEKNSDKNQQIQQLGRLMNIYDIDDTYARSLICVAGRQNSIGMLGFNFDPQCQNTNLEQNSSGVKKNFQEILQPVPYETIFTDILIFEVIRHTATQRINRIAKHVINRINNGRIQQIEIDDDNEESLEELQKQNQYVGKLNMRSVVPQTESSPINLQSDLINLINLDIVLLKRIRVIGGVQSIMADPSMLVVLNGKAAFVFGFQTGDLLDDKNKKTDEKKKIISTRNDFCSCSSPVYDEQQQISTILPYHFSVSEIRNAHDFLKGIFYSTITAANSSNSENIQNFIDVKAKQTIQSSIGSKHINVRKNNISSDHSVAMSTAVQARDLQLKLLSFIQTPSPITSFSIHPVFGRRYMFIFDSYVKYAETIPRQYFSFTQFTQHIRSILHPYYQKLSWVVRFALAYAPIGIAVMDLCIQVQFPISVETELKNTQRFCIFNPCYISNSMKDKKLMNINIKQYQTVIIDILKKSTQSQLADSQIQCHNSVSNNNQIKLKPPSLIPLLIASQKSSEMKQTLQKIGQFLSQDEEELVFSHYAKQQNQEPQGQAILLKFTPGCFLTLVAHDFSPSLLTSIQLIDMENIAVVADHEVLIYKLFPNSLHPHNLKLFKKLEYMKKKQEYQEINIKKKFDVKQFGLQEEDEEDKDKIENQEIINQEINQLNDIKPNRANVLFSTRDQPAGNLVLSIRIPTENNVAFLFQSSIGLHTLFGGMHGQLIRRLSKLSAKMRQDCDEMSVFTAVTIDNASESREKFGANETKTITAQLSFAAINRLKERQRQLEEQLQQNNNECSQSLTQSQLQNTSLTDISSKRRSMLLEKETNALMMSTHALTPINAVQQLPEIPSFVMLQKSGWCARSVPMRYEQFPLRDLLVMTDNILQSQQNFGQIWHNHQNKLIQDYNTYEEKTWRKYVSTEIRNELEETGT